MEVKVNLCTLIEVGEGWVPDYPDTSNQAMLGMCVKINNFCILCGDYTYVDLSFYMSSDLEPGSSSDDDSVETSNHLTREEDGYLAVEGRPGLFYKVAIQMSRVLWTNKYTNIIMSVAGAWVQSLWGEAAWGTDIVTSQLSTGREHREKGMG